MAHLSLDGVSICWWSRSLLWPKRLHNKIWVITLRPSWRLCISNPRKFVGSLPDLLPQPSDGHVPLECRIECPNPSRFKSIPQQIEDRFALAQATLCHPERHEEAQPSSQAGGPQASYLHSGIVSVSAAASLSAYPNFSHDMFPRPMDFRAKWVKGHTKWAKDNQVGTRIFHSVTGTPTRKNPSWFWEVSIKNSMRMFAKKYPEAAMQITSMRERQARVQSKHYRISWNQNSVGTCENQKLDGRQLISYWPRGGSWALWTLRNRSTRCHTWTLMMKISCVWRQYLTPMKMESKSDYFLPTTIPWMLWLWSKAKWKIPFYNSRTLPDWQRGGCPHGYSH